MDNPILLTCKTVAEAVPEIATLLQQYPLYYGHGMQTSTDEAAYLVSFVAGLPPDFESEFSTTALDQESIQQLQGYLQKRIFLRIPLAYLLGETWLSGVKFLVNDHVLIPRSPIAELISDRFYPWWPHAQTPSRILDLCTGCGCLGILAALEFDNTQVDVSDIDIQALEVAIRNIALHGLEKRIKAVHSNVYQQLPGHRYDIILTNPPYVPQSEQSDLPSEYSHEPEHALFAGQDGLDIAKRIIFGATQFLSEKGILVLEVGQSADALQQQFRQHDFMWHELEQGGEGVCVLSYQECKQIIETNSVE